MKSIKNKNEENDDKKTHHFKLDPAINRYTIRLNGEKHARFLSLFEQSGMKTKSQFIISRIYGEEFKVIKIDKNTVDYTTKLTKLFSQFRAIGVLYNQVVKELHSNFSEKRTLALLYKLEGHTIELVNVNKKIIELTREFENKYLKK